MADTGLNLQKKSNNSDSVRIILTAIFLVFITITTGCTQWSGPDDYYKRGVYYNNNYNQFDKALENLNASLELDPDNPELWFARGVALYNLKRYDESLDSLNSTLLIDPEYGAALYLKGDILRIVGRVNESEMYLAKAKKFGYSVE